MNELDFALRIVSEGKIINMKSTLRNGLEPLTFRLTAGCSTN
jgi:hypothetical protein